MKLFGRREKNGTAYEKGLRGEKAALAHLKKKGYRILEKRWRCPGGEVDLICEDGETIVFVEVKYRPDGHEGDGTAAVTPEKMRRLCLCADRYLGPNPDRNARIDILEITMDGIRHIQNVY